VATEMGEYVVGAYLKLILQCDFVDYNVRPPGGGMKGLGELDVVGLDFTSGTAILCEVTTHLGGLEYGKGYEETAKRLRDKYHRQQEYAKESLANFPLKRYMFWSPRVPEGRLLELLKQIDGLELVVNAKYTECMGALRQEARSTMRDIGNPFFRALQILEHLRP
jgi:hypothetical protein